MFIYAFRGLGKTCLLKSVALLWDFRYKAYKDQTQSLYSTPRYDPVFVEPNNLKEYETQVLQMSVPLDDDASYNDLQLDFSAKNHAFSLENVSYITKDPNSGKFVNNTPVCNVWNGIKTKRLRREK